MMSFIRKAVGRELDFEKGLSRYKKQKTEIDFLNEEISFLALQYKSTTDSFKKALIQFPERRDSYNKRYNVFFSDYIDQVGVIKREIDQLSKSTDYIKAGVPFLQPYLDMVARALRDGYQWRYEKYLKDGMGKRRKELPQYSYKDVEKLVSILNDDNVTLNRVSIPINILRPTQADFDTEKIRDMMEVGIKDKDFVPVISKDLFILDGHHRWAAGLEEDEDEIIEAYLVNISMEELLKRVKGYGKLQKAALIILSAAAKSGKIDKEIIEEWTLTSE